MNVLGSQSHLELEVADNPWTLWRTAVNLPGAKPVILALRGCREVDITPGHLLLQTSGEDPT